MARVISALQKGLYLWKWPAGSGVKINPPANQGSAVNFDNINSTKKIKSTLIQHQNILDMLFLPSPAIRHFVHRVCVLA